MNDMKKNMKKYAFTLIETMIVMILLAVIALAVYKVAKSQLGFIKRCCYYATFRNLKRVTGECIAQQYLPVGITQADVDAAKAAMDAALAYYNGLPTTEIIGYVRGEFNGSQTILQEKQAADTAAGML